MVPATARRYRPDPVRSFLGPKPRGGWRRFAILSHRDERTWDALAGRVARILEPRLHPGVAANRTVAASGGWRLESTGAALRRARTVAPGHGLVVRTDIEEFYGSITPAILARALADVGVPPEASSLAGDMIEGWGQSGYRGLPIGPAGSAVLANAVLTGVDHALSTLRFVRWVDDYVISVPSERAAADVLDRLDVSFARLGLRRSVRKTEVLEGIGDITWLRKGPPGFVSPAQG
jgi:Reverse transcriptase (RNA-dependent DNA polymerase)